MPYQVYECTAKNLEEYLNRLEQEGWALLKIIHTVHDKDSHFGDSGRDWFIIIAHKVGDKKF